MNPKVDAIIGQSTQWKEAFEALRAILLDLPLTEEVKWGQPCYTLDGANVVLMHGFKEYCALLFMKGALMKDPKGVLIQQTENTQAARQIRFTRASEITRLKATLKAYVKEAIELERTGAKVEFKQTASFAVPEEFQSKLDAAPKLKAAFEALTPGRQRAYLLHFASAKQSATRSARVEKCTPMILAGKGLNDE